MQCCLTLMDMRELRKNLRLCARDPDFQIFRLFVVHVLFGQSWNSINNYTLLKFVALILWLVLYSSLSISTTSHVVVYCVYSWEDMKFHK